MTCRDVERDVDLYVDRELAGDVAEAIRAHLATCSACSRRVEQREAIGRLVRAVPYHVASDRLRTRVSLQARQQIVRRRLLTLAAAAAVVLAVSSGIVFSIMRSASARADAAASEIVNAHVRSMAERLFDVQSTDQHTVKPWFQGKIDFAPPVTDLSAIGFPLVGGRLDSVGGRSVAALVYQRQKHIINVFISPVPDADSRISERTVRGFHLRTWVHDQMAFAVISDLNDAELTTFAEALRQR